MVRSEPLSLEHQRRLREMRRRAVGRVAMRATLTRTRRSAAVPLPTRSRRARPWAWVAAPPRQLPSTRRASTVATEATFGYRSRTPPCIAEDQPR